MYAFIGLYVCILFCSLLYSMYVLRFKKNVATWVTHYVYLRKGKKKEQKKTIVHI